MALFPGRAHWPTGRPGSEGELRLKAVRAWSLDLTAVRRVTLAAEGRATRAGSQG